MAAKLHSQHCCCRSAGSLNVSSQQQLPTCAFFQLAQPETLSQLHYCHIFRKRKIIMDRGFIFSLSLQQCLTCEFGFFKLTLLETTVLELLYRYTFRQRTIFTDRGFIINFCQRQLPTCVFGFFQLRQPETLSQILYCNNF